MKIAVIGGSGFIGTKLIELLVAGKHDVKILDTKRSEKYPDMWVECDIRDIQSLKDNLQGIEVIYNLAAEHRDDVRPLSLYTDVNVAGSQNVCDAANELGINNIIFTSTVAVYGFPKDEPNEHTPFNPFNEYGRTKAEAENIYQSWLAEKPKERHLTILRPTAVFGPDNRGNVYNLIRQIAGGKFVMIGNGKNRKSLAYVDNVAAFLALSLTFDAGAHIYNYVDKPDFDMNHLVTTVRETLGKGNGIGLRLPYFIGMIAGLAFDMLAAITRRNFPISRIRVEKFCANTVFNADKLQETGFTAPVDIKDGLVTTLKHEFK
jgi:nucleoside-diphosphate-sugar epimerase